MPPAGLVWPTVHGPWAVQVLGPVAGTVTSVVLVVVVDAVVVVAGAFTVVTGALVVTEARAVVVGEVRGAADVCGSAAFLVGAEAAGMLWESPAPPQAARASGMAVVMRPNAEANLGVRQTLRQQRDTIEHDLGSKLDWQELDGKRAYGIRIDRPGSVKDVEAHADMVEWLLVQHLAFRRVFRPLVQALPGSLWVRSTVAEELDDRDLD